MEQDRILQILQEVKAGAVTPEQAMLDLKMCPFEDLGYAKVDHHRALRQGIPEVIFGSGKTPGQIVGITRSMLARGSGVLITRLSPEAAEAVAAEIEISYDPVSRIAFAGERPAPDTGGRIVVAEEAAVTAESLGNPVERLYDVGVAGLHRLLARLDVLMSARVVIAVAGMEGALASVIGGLCDCPVIAVPTSIGYGANFGGLSALLSMLNSCASGVSVVNIDNGFGAGYLASMINHIGG